MKKSKYNAYISDEDQKFIKHLKNIGKEVEAIKKLGI